MTTDDYRVIYSIPITNLTVEDVLLIKSQFEITNNQDSVVNFGYYLLRATDPAAVTEGKKITQLVSASVLQTLHHYVPNLIGVDIGANGDYYYNIVAYARTDQAAPNDALVVEQHYGDLTALMFDREKSAKKWWQCFLPCR